MMKLLAFSILALVASCQDGLSNQDVDAAFRAWDGFTHADNAFTANTTQGPIIGHRASNVSNVIEFLGIPYAKPPIGQLRFASPQKYEGWETRNATTYSPICPQNPSKPVDYPGRTPQFQTIIANFGAQLGHAQSEDCLTLNVWTKSTPGTKAVLVFFHGGRWSLGETNTPFYTGQYIAGAEDIIVVTVQYRMNIFGFPGTPDGPKNLAFEDQRLAVEWVRDNIAAFNGDADRIAIMGQSSGAVAVDYWSYSFTADPIVAGLISHSGNAFSFATNNGSLAATHWYNASAYLGCGSSGDTLSCMRDKTMEEIKAAALQVKAPPGSSRARTQPAFQPTVDNITVLEIREYSRRSSRGEFAKIPYLLGNTDNEAGYYRVTAFATGTILDNQAWDDFILESFTCPNTFEAINRARAGVPVWSYRYFGDWDNLRLYPNSSAYHGVDMHMIFGGGYDITGIPNSTPEAETIRLMMRAWASFVKDPKAGLSNNIGWPQYSVETSSLIRLAYDNRSEVSFVHPEVYSKACASKNYTWFGV